MIKKQVETANMCINSEDFVDSCSLDCEQNEVLKTEI